MTELPAAELQRVTLRVNRTLERFGALSYHALLYRVGEVGRNRIEPHLLRRVLQEVANNPRPRRGRSPPGPWHPPQGLYVEPTWSEKEALDLAATKLPPLLEQVALLHPKASHDLATRFASTLDHHVVIDPFESHDNWIAPDLQLNTDSHTATPLSQNANGSHSTVWFTADLDWLYPTDVRLWAFLETCVTNGTGAVIVARKVPVMLFALLKALELRAVQYFGIVVPEAALHDAERLRIESGWSKFTTASLLLQQPFAAHLQNAVNAGSPSGLHRRAQAIEVARDLGFLEGREIEPSRLLEWWDRAALDCPRQARAEIVRWAEWTGYKRPRRRAASTAAEVGEVESNAELREQSASDPADKAKLLAEFGRRTLKARIPLRGY